MTKQRLSRYWHGGVPGLRPGDTIRPAAELATQPAIYAAAAARGGRTDYDCDPTWAYVTTDKNLARAYAAKALHAGGISGHLYNVKPRGPLEPDPDYDEDLKISFMCAAAKVLAVVEQNITLTPALMVYASQHTTWDNGDPMYTRDGYALPSPQMRALGLTAADLRDLGPTPSFEEIDVYARHWLLEHNVTLPQP